MTGRKIPPLRSEGRGGSARNDDENLFGIADDGACSRALCNSAIEECRFSQKMLSL